MSLQHVDLFQEAVHDQHPREVHILSGHSDIIRIISRVDDKRYLIVVFVCHFIWIIGLLLPQMMPLQLCGMWRCVVEHYVLVAKLFFHNV